MKHKTSSLPIWRQRIESALLAATNQHTVNYMQLASADSQLGPQVRTVVFRGFDPFNEQIEPRIWVATDGDSDKVSQYDANPKAQAAWYFTDTREQFRLSGEVDLVGSKEPDQQGRTALWQSMSKRARESFFSIVGSANELTGDSAEAFELALPPDNFVLLSLRVSQVEHLQIAQLPHQCTRFWCEQGCWHSQDLEV